MATVQVRYIVNDVDAAIAFYCRVGGPSLGSSGKNLYVLDTR